MNIKVATVTSVLLMTLQGCIIDPSFHLTSSSSSQLSSSSTSSVVSTMSTVSSTSSVVDNTFNPTEEEFSLIQDEADYVGIPSTGVVKILVFAVDFSDYPAAASGVSLADIETVFNGPADATDYQSLASYYEQSSYGNLTLDADVFGYYRAEHPSWWYEPEDTTESVLIDDLLQYYDSQIDYSDYDANGDGFIDSIYVMYSRPYDSDTDRWWAYQYYTFLDTEYDQTGSDFYLWMSTAFLLDGATGLDARTIIHESGHAMGLEDYYDYDESDSYNSGGLGGADMMDYTVGDHNPFSKLILGWLKPQIVTQSITVTLNPYESSGQVLLVTPQWNGSVFDEYLLIAFYTPTGLYEQEQYYYWDRSGVVIYHVDARIDNGWDDQSMYYSIYNYNNTDTSHKLISIVEADGDDSVSDTTWVENDDLFDVNDTYEISQWFKAFTSNDNVEISIDSMTSTSVTVTINFLS